MSRNAFCQTEYTYTMVISRSLSFHRPRSIHIHVGGRVWGGWFPRWCLAPCAGAPLRCCSGACFLAFDET